MLLRSRTHFLSANLFTALCTVLVIHPICTAQNIPIGGMDQGLGINPGQQAGEIFTGTGISSVYGGMQCYLNSICKRLETCCVLLR